MQVETGQARPRAYYPHGIAARRPGATTPGWDLGPERRIDDGRTVARALGWFSIGLGAVQLTAPHLLTRFLGLDDEHENVMRLYGAREVAHGVAILAERTPTAAVWTRVGGDLLDLATLGTVLGRAKPRRHRVLLAMGMVAGIGILDALTARRLSHGPARATRRARPTGSNGRSDA
jgi:hypothetical protein